VKLDEILKFYQEEPELQSFAEKIKTSAGSKFQIKGTAGSMSAMLVAALHRMTDRSIVIILNDKEEALYFQNDLNALMPRKSVFLFPASYKRPYQVEEIDNANVLMRAELLNELNHTRTGRQVIVTFAEALYEKVVNKRSLIKNTLEIKTGQEIGMDFALEVLETYGFEREDYVFEPGQFAVRGGILDVFSFAHDLPYRIEFFGDEIESIRTFDPVEQISNEKVKRVSLIPNIQKQMLMEEQVSFLEYISASSLIVSRNIEFIEADLHRLFQKAETAYASLVSNSGGGSVSKEPQDLYFSPDDFRQQLKTFAVLEINRDPYYKLREATLDWPGSAQPTFRSAGGEKEFQLLAEHFHANQDEGIQTFVLSDSEKQIRRLTEIFESIDTPDLFQGAMGELHEGFLDQRLNLALYTDHQIFNRYHRYKSKASAQRSQAITLRELRDLNPGDYVVHVHHGIGKFAGLHTLKVGEHIQEAAKVIYKNGDAIFVNVNALHKITKYTGKEGTIPKLSKLGSPAWQNTKSKTKKRIKELAFDLVDLYAKRKTTHGFGFSADSYLNQELEASFMYEDTPDQLKTTEEVKRDMEKPYPMDRLVCGDVGFGKTEIAIRAAFKAAVDGKQVAVLVPTTILALQHYKTFKERLKDMPVEVDYVNRFKSSAKIKETLKKVASGKVDILIGTHRLVSKDVKFKDLGLLVIDEEQRFGVGVKEKLKLMKSNVDTLTLTATPIPRTLQFSLAGIRDLSVITTPPPNRQPIETVVTTFSPTIVRDAIAYELKRGGQVYFIHPRIKDIEEVAAGIKKLVPDARIAIGHGQMPGVKLEKIMTNFIEGAYDVLVATTIIESGLDIPNANTILINEANKYGLGDLHQMRGRVGRSNRKAFCYLIAPPEISQTQDARKRLKAMEEFSDLGSGFHIALRDLDIRGAGDLLGAEQSGFIHEIGYDMYHKILDETIRELKEEHFAELFPEEAGKRKEILAEDCKIDLDLDIRMPERYVPSIPERLKFYRRIAGAENEEELRDVQREMLDRFGPLPESVLALFDATRVREKARRVGLERVVLKNGTLRLYFISNQDSKFFATGIFSRILLYVQTYTAKVRIKESPKYLSLIFDNVHDIKDVLERVAELHDFAHFVPEEEEETSMHFPD
jgi:transcription-repair coupling factor (superfamily II helicase)